MERRLDYKKEKSKLVIDEPKGLRHRRIPLTDDLEALLSRIKENIYLLMIISLKIIINDAQNEV